MAYMGSKKCTVSKEGLSWVVKNIKKLKEFGETKPYMASKKLLDLIPEILEKYESYLDETKEDFLAEDCPEKVSVMLNVEHRELLESIAASSLKALEQGIIPGYKKRMNGPKNNKKYKPYLKKAEKSRDLVASIKEGYSNGAR